ncbi:OLC1v1021508C1 [Oldenlandia corymbosa var. corymbosa]|uniref:non-specific serine/threonine protein kinase n=1 Tax=Oldenlandia corymbosa var. corymbosa TaxID=529605 RepID=A0AAV1BW21_OLDCO|nr:OLC1v1021508C1 [Oldenlandia corymbosa var. corymbosa]
MNGQRLLLLLLSFLLLLFRQISATDFVINRFNSSSVLLYGNATIESHILTLTKDSTFSIGRALYPTKIAAKKPNSSYVLPFSTSFIFAMAPNKLYNPGHGIVFLFVPKTGIDGTAASQNLGLLNLTNLGNPDDHLFGVEFDVFKNEEFKDISDSHVGIDINSLVSDFAHDAGYWPDDGQPFKTVKMNNGKTYQVWIDYADSRINVTMAPTGMKRPKQPLLNATVNLSQVFQDEMYVGFTSSTGQLVQSHKILAWSYSNTNFSLSEALITNGLPSFELPKEPIFKQKGFIVGVTVGVVLVFILTSLSSFVLVKIYLRRKREREEMEEWELEYWPHRMTYQEIEAATKDFSEENVIGIGGNGKVYKGTLVGGAEVAVKRISHQNSEGMREFVSEVSSLGRLKHRNLVGLRGWCKKEKGSFILVYDYMENGSLDERIFLRDNSKLLSCEERIRILKDVASALFYLHEGWESKVLHRDIKASNVLLDKDMNARLGDFGLARMHDHNQMAATTHVVGTIGYMAPELIKSGKSSTQTDVFSFGILILEVLCGRTPIDEGKPLLVDWVLELLRLDELINALDERVKANGGFNEEEVERVLHLGLLCAHPDPNVRPTMRQVVKLLEGKNPELVDESEDEDSELYLLDKMKTRNFRWPDMSFSSSSQSQSHPTFDEIREGLSSSMTISWSKSMAVGR